MLDAGDVRHKVLVHIDVAVLDDAHVPRLEGDWDAQEGLGHLLQERDDVAVKKVLVRQVLGVVYGVRVVVDLVQHQFLKAVEEVATDNGNQVLLLSLPDGRS